VVNEVIDGVEEAASELGHNGTEAGGDTHHPAHVSVDVRCNVAAPPQTDTPTVVFGARKRSILFSIMSL